MFFLSRIASRLSKDMGIDLGTANSLVYVKGRGILLREPSVVAIENNSGRVLAVGEEAKRMIGRTPASIVAVRPLKDGVIANFDITEKMLSYFITKIHKRRTLVHPQVIIGIPYGVTEVEKRAVLDAALRAGARDPQLIEEPMAAAIGCGLPVTEPRGSMIVDIGGGTTEIAVISLGGIVTCRSIRIAGDEIDEAIASYIRRVHNLLIGESTAEMIKINIGSAFPLEEELEMEVKGRDLLTGLPRSVVVRSEEIREAIAEPLNAIVEAIKLALEATPPELSADIMERGIVLTGGGALLKKMDTLISYETGIPIIVDSDPLISVVMGTGKFLEELELSSALRNVLVGRSSFS